MNKHNLGSASIGTDRVKGRRCYLIIGFEGSKVVVLRDRFEFPPEEPITLFKLVARVARYYWRDVGLVKDGKQA